MHRIGAIVLLGFFATIGLSCQDASSPGPAAPITALPSVLATGICRGYAKCGGTEGLELQKDCIARLAARFTESSGPVIEAGLESETIVYNPDFIQECSGRLANCGMTNQMPESCRAMVNGTTADGASCTADLECKVGSACVPGAGDTCPGTCTPWAAAGGACTGDGDCERGLKCNDDDDKCEVPLAEGVACEDNDECGYFLVCIDADGSGSAGTTCESSVKLQTAGFEQECGSSASPPTAPLCQNTFSCTKVDGTGVCVAASDAGASCLPGFPDPCPQAQYCEATKCAPLPKADEACVTYSIVLNKQCAAGFFCNDATKCQVLIENGSTCDEAKYDGKDCVSGICLDDVCSGDYVCASPPG